jgi:hypothetical protein
LSISQFSERIEGESGGWVALEKIATASAPWLELPIVPLDCVLACEVD